MSKELSFTDGNSDVKYLDTTSKFTLAITQDGAAFDLTNAVAIDVKVANATGYVFDKSIALPTTDADKLGGIIQMPVDDEVMTALVPDDYWIEVWVTLSSLVNPGSQEGLTEGDIGVATITEANSYNAIFSSDEPLGFEITDNIMSDNGDVIPVMSLNAFQQEFDHMCDHLEEEVSKLVGPQGEKGDSAYQLAVEAGYSGTKEQWLASLKGKTGDTGATGSAGPKGDTGHGVEIKGKVDTTSQLPKTANEADGYLVGEELYIWIANAWKACGQIQGPAGKDGAAGPQGLRGPAGKDATPVDLNNYPTKDQLAAKANVDSIDHRVMTRATLTASDDVLKLTDGTYTVWGELPQNMPEINGGENSWGYVVVKSVNSNRFVTFTDVFHNQLVNVLYNDPLTWSGWQVPNAGTMATKSEVTTAVNTATANTVDSSKPTNFTDGLQSKGVDVATVGASVGDIYPMKPMNFGSGLITITDITDQKISGKFELSASMFCIGITGAGVPSFPDKFTKNLSITISESVVHSLGKDVTGSYTIKDYGKGKMGFSPIPAGNSSVINVVFGTASGTFTCDL